MIESFYKDHSCLVFHMDDGKDIKYDFATQSIIGSRGKPVKSVNGHFASMSIHEMLACCSDPCYARFLNFVFNRSGCRCTNMGSVLRNIPRYANCEQYFSAGLDLREDIRIPFSEVPKGFVHLAKANSLPVTEKFLNAYKDDPELFQVAFSLELQTISPKELLEALTRGASTRYYITGTQSNAHRLIKDYGYTPKALVLYLDRLSTFEALPPFKTIGELEDYARMMQRISPKFDRYPRHFLTTHEIASRNYNRCRMRFDEESFARRIDRRMECTIGDYVFIYPSCTQDIKDEASQQNNCVASYISNVIDGRCHILFMRYKSSPEKSLVTLEIVNGKVVQARRHFNYNITDTDQQAIDAWEKIYSNRLKEDSENGQNPTEAA